jgi:acetylglutamate kinase
VAEHQASAGHGGRDRLISGGMLPKLEACKQALKHGVGRVRILPAAEAEALPQFYLTKLKVVERK